MQTGKLRHLVTIQTLTNSETDGITSQNWEDTSTAYASIKPMSGNEIPQGEAVIGEQWYLITMRYLDLDSVNNRIKFDGNIFHFKTVKNLDFRNIKLEIEAVVRNGN